MQGGFVRPRQPGARETEVEAIAKLLNANGSQGWELDRLEDSAHRQYRSFWLKRRVTT